MRAWRLSAGLLCVLALLVSAAAICAADGLGATPQLLLNAGFEKGDGPRVADWGLWPPAGDEAGVSSTRDLEVKHSGAASGRLQVTRDDFSGVCTFHHSAVAVEAGQELVLQYWVKAQGADQCGCDVQLRHGTQEIVGSAATPTDKGSFDWKLVTHRFTVPVGTDHVCVVPLLRGKGTVWFDDIVLYATPAVSPTRLTQPPLVDGDLGDTCWQSVTPVSGFVLADGSGLPERSTSVWAAYDPGHLYFAFRCEKKPGDRLLKTVTQRDGVVWNDDEVELFLNPRGDWGDYYQFIVNPLGTKYDSHLTDASWSANWQAAARDDETAWTVEIAIPVSELPLDLSTGRDWCANFGRADKVGGQASSWSCVFGGFHTSGRFGRLTGMDLDLTSFYLADARARVGAVRRDYDTALAGLDLKTAPAVVAEPVREPAERIRQGLQELENLLARPTAATAQDWARVRPEALKLAEEITALRAASLRLRAWTVWGGKTAPSMSFGLATAPAMVKVRRDGQDFAGEVAPELSLSAARNESEGAQVVVVSLADRDLEVQAEVGELQGPGGAKLAAENLKLGLVGYVTTSKPGYRTAYVGDWPDPIQPYKPFRLKAGEVQPLWVRLYVPTGTPAGDYSGVVTITSGQERREMRLKLHVFDFDLPRRQHLATPFGCDPSSLSRWYTGSADYQSKMPVEVWQRWNRFLLDYRLTPTHVGRAYVKREVDDHGQVSWDYSIADRCIADIADRLPLSGVAMAGIGSVGWSAIWGVTLKAEGGAHSGQTCGRVSWAKTDHWQSLSRPMPGQVVAERGFKAFRFWVRALDADSAEQTLAVFTNALPTRFITSFKVGGTDWHEVRLPLEQFHNNATGTVMTPEDVKSCGDFQLVIGKAERPVAFLLDDVVAECADGDVVVDDFEEATQVARLKAEMGSQLQYWQDKGWLPLGHVYAKDEIQPAEYEQLLPLYRRALEAFPGAPLMQTYYMNRTPQDLVGVIKTWCAITSIHDDDFLSARRKAGEQTWLYVCCGPQPPFANFFIDQPGVDHRVLLWQTWQKQCTGLLYWETNYWHGMMPSSAEDPRWPEVPWDQAQVATYKEFKVNGDGFLIYPGPNWEPWPSVRLENIRDGIEDYEYLWLLRERDPGNELLQVGEDISRDFTHFTKDPQVLQQRRLAIAQALEKLSSR